MLSNQEIWLTDRRYLNDKNEGKDIYKIVDKLLQEHPRLNKESASHIKNLIHRFENKCSDYTASFSRAPDLLSQWRGYCPPEGGYCIGFKGLSRDTTDIHDKSNESLFHWLDNPKDCVYEHDEKVKLVSYILETIVDLIDSDLDEDKAGNVGRMLASNFQRARMIFKDSNFSEEREVRLLLQPHENVTPFIRCKGNLLVPYFKVSFDSEIVEEIIIGPSTNSDLAEEGIRVFLRGLGDNYQHVRVKHSQIPYRNV
ncbi:TPA: DUF2971 domain-containing protein [Vibrio cholerae]|nr:DUF2971 domain-containing protein [Vibrio cholerae]HDV5477949.1 DUF2971 domain-containing protein [Vibrio cholerae]HDV5648185.1 DUF2971 domain-containing protein [Vibrio cholerae]